MHFFCGVDFEPGTESHPAPCHTLANHRIQSHINSCSPCQNSVDYRKAKIAVHALQSVAESHALTRVVHVRVQWITERLNYPYIH